MVAIGLKQAESPESRAALQAIAGGVVSSSWREHRRLRRAGSRTNATISIDLPIADGEILTHGKRPLLGRTKQQAVKQSVSQSGGRAGRQRHTALQSVSQRASRSASIAHSEPGQAASRLLPVAASAGAVAAGLCCAAFTQARRRGLQPPPAKTSPTPLHKRRRRHKPS